MPLGLSILDRGVRHRFSGNLPRAPAWRQNSVRKKRHFRLQVPEPFSSWMRNAEEKCASYSVLHDWQDWYI